MLRPILTELLLFLAPFAIYALYVVAVRRGAVLNRANWPLKHLIWLTAIAFLSVLGSLVFLAQWGAAPPRSTYIPAHLENGKLIPGKTQ